MSGTVKLNLGCGDKRRDGYLNVDACGAPDLLCDLSVFPWPWADGSVDEVFSEHFLEHVQDYEKTILVPCSAFSHTHDGLASAQMAIQLSYAPSFMRAIALSVGRASSV